MNVLYWNQDIDIMIAAMNDSVPYSLSKSLPIGPAHATLEK